MRRLKRKKRKPTHARLDVGSRAMIWALSLVGIERSRIRDLVDKTDGTPPTIKAIDLTLAKKRKYPDWRGTDEEKPGQPDKLTAAQKKQVGVRGAWEICCYSEVLQEVPPIPAEGLQEHCMQSVARCWIEVA